MKDKEEILNEIKSAEELIEEMHADREKLMNTNKGVTPEYNQDFHDDLGFLNYKIQILKWVLQ